MKIKSKNLLVIVAVAICFYMSVTLTSCGKNDGAPANALTIAIDAGFIDNTTDPSERIWFMTSDLNGRVINISEALNGQRIVFNYDDSIQDEKVYLTEVMYSTASGRAVCNATSYLVPRRSEYTFSAEKSVAFIGVSQVTVKNLPANPFRPIFTLGGGNNTLSTFGGNSLSLELSQTKSPDNLFISIMETDHDVPYFKWIKNVEIHKQYETDFTTFEAMNPYSISIPANDGAGYTISGSENGSEMIHPISYSLITGGDRTKATVYAPATGFAQYITNIQFYQQNAYFEISRIGTNLPAAIEQPSFDVNIINAAPADFSLGTTGHYDYSIAYFANADFSFGWSIYNPESATTSGILPVMPLVVRIAFPGAKRDDLTMVQSAVLEDENVNGYDDFIKSLGAASKKSYTFASLTKTK